ncbi:MAG: SPOR domain-containing protein [Gammaproteobacteria bacterium]|nr:SPOR domain-containing protein [Gammaproteobacteria bacterium]
MLRVVVDANSLSAPTRLSVRYDNGTVSTLFVDPADIAYAPALFLGEKQRFAADTLDTIDAVRRAEPAKEWILAGYVELALPKSVRSVAVSTHSDSLQVALQYRSRRPFELTELELQEALRRVGAGVPMQILQRLVRNAAKIDSGDIANTGSYAIQLGAFANFANADRLTAQLRDLGYVIYQKLGHIDATAVKRVLIGPFPDREAGDRARREFRADKRLAAAITRNARLVEVAAIAPGAGQALELDLQTLSTWVNHDSAWDLAHHYLPLARLLKAADRRFRRPVAPIVQQNPAELTPAEATRLEQLARRHQQDGAWLPALQAWSILARSDLADARRAGYSGTVRALFRLGEVNLADRLLRSLFLYDRDPVIRDNAFSRLVEYNRNQNNNLGLQNLLASAALRIPGVAVFRLLSENLLASDRPDLALTLATALPRAEQPVDVVLLASLQERAWSLFEATLDDVRSEVERNLWRGFRAQREHRYDLARDYWKRAGDEGAALRDALIDGLGIAQRMNTGGSASAGTIRRWEAWQQKHPGERQWRNAEAVVVESGGSVIVYSPERDEYSRSYRSTRELPARISIDGPAKIRIRARPLYADTAGVPFDGWIHVHNGDRYERFPINGNRPAEGVDLVGADELLAGLLVPIQYEVGPGHHEINVFSDERPLLLGVDAWLPELPLAVLAELRHPSAAQLADGIQSGITQSAPAGVRRVIDQIGQWLSSGDAGEAVRVTAAGESKSKAAVPNTSDWVGPSDRDFAIRQMQELVWETERGEVPAEHLLPAAARIATQYPDAPGMQELLARLTRRTVWQPVRSVEHSAGSRFVETIGWHPGSPSVQVRKTLLGEIPNDNHVISSRQQFGLELSRSKPSTLEIELTRGDLPFLLAHPLSAYYVVDDGSHHGVELMPGAPSRRVRVEVPAGAHTVSVGIDKPFANQFLKIRVAEIEAGRTVPIPPAANLMYQVATLAEPLIVRIKGPAWLRVDERAGDRVQQHFKIVADGWQTLTFGPTAPRDESLFRLYRRAIDTERHLITLQRPEQATPRLAEFRVDIPEISAPAAPALTSTGMADESVDGVWNAYGSTVQRRNFDEDNVSNSERFLELGATHRYYSAARNGYFRTDFLGRIRETGGPTLGVRERIELRSENHRYLIRLGGSALAQNPGGNMDGAEWAASLFASVISERPLGENTNHYPTARIFRRWLSLDADEITEPDRVDQDIFTEYKSQHLHGLSVTDTLIHRPWLDTRWYAAPTLTTNEDFNPFDPEFVQLRLGWKQLVGTWELDAQYRLRHYLEDDDRANSFTQHLLRMDLDWSPWIIDSRSWQATFRLSHDIDSAENSFRLSVSRPFRNSRTTLRHFRPGEIDFLDIRRDHAINSDN